MAVQNTELFDAMCRNNAPVVRAAIEKCADQKVIDAIEAELLPADYAEQKINQAVKLLQEAGETDLANTVSAQRVAQKEV